MAVVTMTKPPLPVEVQAFLKRRGAEEEFELTLTAVQACYPELSGLEVSLQEDWEVDGWWHVILRVILPATFSEEHLGDRDRRFFQELVQQVPPTRFPDPVCLVSLGFADG